MVKQFIEIPGSGSDSQWPPFLFLSILLNIRHRMIYISFFFTILQVIDLLENFLAVLVASFAALAAIMGIVVLEGFFRNKLKDLFTDTNYFIYFFLVSGYFLYALGEVSYYLFTTLFAVSSSVGISDLYWSAGSILILLSFVSLTFTLAGSSAYKSKLGLLAIFGVGLVVSVLLILTRVTFADVSSYFFGYFYPIMGSLIVAFSLSVVIYSEEAGHFNKPLFFFFLASSFILVGDIFFTYLVSHNIPEVGLLEIIIDTSYLLGYGLSAIAFLWLRVKMFNAPVNMKSTY